MSRKWWGSKVRSLPEVKAREDVEERSTGRCLQLQGDPSPTHPRPRYNLMAFPAPSGEGSLGL